MVSDFRILGTSDFPLDMGEVGCPNIADFGNQSAEYGTQLSRIRKENT